MDSRIVILQVKSNQAIPKICYRGPDSQATACSLTCQFDAGDVAGVAAVLDLTNLFCALCHLDPYMAQDRPEGWIIADRLLFFGQPLFTCQPIANL